MMRPQQSNTKFGVTEGCVLGYGLCPRPTPNEVVAVVTCRYVNVKGLPLVLVDHDMFIHA